MGPKKVLQQLQQHDGVTPVAPPKVTKRATKSKIQTSNHSCNHFSFDSIIRFSFTTFS